jgi:hypothetical protein
VVNISLVNAIAGTDAITGRAAGETGVLVIGSVLQGVHVIGVVFVSLRLVQKSVYTRYTCNMPCHSKYASLIDSFIVCDS